MALALDMYPDKFQPEHVARCKQCHDFIYPGDHVYKHGDNILCSEGCLHDHAEDEAEFICIDEVEK